jgi:hypothetical protein
MDIYTVTTGVEMTIKWANEGEYQLGKKFLTDMGAGCGPPDKASDHDQKPEFFYLQNEKQLHALLNFMRSLKEKSKT